MGISIYPSKVNLPQQAFGCLTVLDYLIKTFPLIPAEVWQQRLDDGKVHWRNGDLIRTNTPFQAQQCVFYYREVENEPVIPFVEHILYQDEHILVADKPHFLPVTPGGVYVHECLQNRLRLITGNRNLQTLHRLDRETAGLVLFSLNPDTLPLYAKLFAERRIQKTYHAIAHVNAEANIVGKKWTVKNRLEKSTPRFLMQEVAGEINAHSEIRCIAQLHDKGLFQLQPLTGKTHQLRLHMQFLGFPLLNDKFYPKLQAQTSDDFAQPLQLLAKELQFIDPLTQQLKHFCSTQHLNSAFFTKTE